MLATEITNHVQQALGRLLQQYQGRPLIAGFYTALVNQIQDLEDAVFDLDSGRQIWDGTSTPAYGAQLDGIGEIVGISRNGLDDQQYILLIFGKIAENFSQDTANDVVSVIQYLFQAEQILMQEIYPAGLFIDILNPALPSSLFAIAKTLVQNAVGAGIQVVMAEQNTVNVFRFAGPGVSGALNGFGDATVANTGGVFTGLI